MPGVAASAALVVHQCPLWCWRLRQFCPEWCQATIQPMHTGVSSFVFGEVIIISLLYRFLHKNQTGCWYWKESFTVRAKHTKTTWRKKRRGTEEKTTGNFMTMMIILWDVDECKMNIVEKINKDKTKMENKNSGQGKHATSWMILLRWICLHKYFGIKAF